VTVLSADLGKGGASVSSDGGARGGRNTMNEDRRTTTQEAVVRYRQELWIGVP